VTETARETASAESLGLVKRGDALAMRITPEAAQPNRKRKYRAGGQVATRQPAPWTTAARSGPRYIAGSRNMHNEHIAGAPR